MSQSSPEGIILGKGSRLVSADLSINGEKVFSIKQEKTYTEKDLLEAFNAGNAQSEQPTNSHTWIKDKFKDFLEKIKNN